MSRILIILFLLSLGNPATAGAWPRERGEGFLSFSFEVEPDTDQNSFATLYGDYGLGRNLTVGLDIGGDERDMYKFIGFLRWSPPYNPDTGLEGAQLAVELGMGFFDENFALRPGVLIGRGYSFGQTSGWLSLDNRATVVVDDGYAQLDTELTAGFQISTRSKALIQLFSTAPSDSSAFLKLAPSLILKQKSGRQLQIGVTAGIANVDEIKLKLGYWHEF